MTGFVECRLVSLLSQADCEDELVREAIIALGSFAHGMYVRDVPVLLTNYGALGAPAFMARLQLFKQATRLTQSTQSLVYSGIYPGSYGRRG